KAYHAAQFWGTRGFFPTYMAALRQPLQEEDLGCWLEIFLAETGRTAGSRVLEWGDLTYAGFGRMIRSLAEETGIADSTKMTSPDWKYGPGNPDTPVLRGEACMALFQLYFHLMEERNVNVHHNSGS
ncbi:MAG: hypothetical protein KDC75_22760, partial [Phaeodactylibacter sp.]|nr:hypothetical protein [Phaeodactylibacter sp.]